MPAVGADAGATYGSGGGIGAAIGGGAGGGGAGGGGFGAQAATSAKADAIIVGLANLSKVPLLNRSANHARIARPSLNRVARYIPANLGHQKRNRRE